MNVGLVLSGGGFRGIAHIGVIKALQEYGINPTHIAGTSAGAIVGALYAVGCDWKEIFLFFEKLEIFRLSKYAINKPGFIDTEKFYDILKPYFPFDDFNNLNKKLFITATDILNGSLKVFSEGELIRPILASAAFPGVFTPVRINDNYYIDGGTLNNFPVDLIKMTCDKIIGVYVNSITTIENKDLTNSFSVLDRAFKIKNTSDSFSKFNSCDLLIAPKGLGNYGTFNTKYLTEIYDAGYNEAIEMLKSKKGVEFLSKNQTLV